MNNLMKRALIFLILILFWGRINCQQINDRNRIVQEEILTANTLMKGIYKNFVEFQQNNPSVRTDFRSNEKNLPVNNIYNNMAVSRLMVPGSNGEFYPFSQEHWGLCDGKHAFINFKGKYHQISVDGKYSSFTASARPDGISTVQTDYLLNIENGWIIRINKVAGYKNKVRLKSVKKILHEENPLMYEEFSQEDNKKMMAFTYIKRLNESLKSK
jgi:hypothetical protein